jgi:hypothetical protein
LKEYFLASQNVVFGFANVVFGYAQTASAGRLSVAEGGSETERIQKRQCFLSVAEGSIA